MERCGMWMRFGPYKTLCGHPYDHDGPCRPLRSDLTRELDRLDEEANALSLAVVEADADNDPWPPEDRPASYLTA